MADNQASSSASSVSGGVKSKKYHRLVDSTEDGGDDNSSINKSGGLMTKKSNDHSVAHSSALSVKSGDDEEEDDEQSSLVSSDDAHNSIIFRSGTWKKSTDADILMEGSVSTMASTNSGALHDAEPGQQQQQEASVVPADQQNPIGMIRSRSNSSDDDLDDDWDDDDAGLSRYNFKLHQVPVPVVQQQQNRFHQRLWSRFSELRVAARQRQAARLLNMASERDLLSKLHACCLSWCCDATDRGILLAAACLATWLVIGCWAFWPMTSSPKYWWIGMIAFVVRVSARRVANAILEGGFSCCRRQQQRRRGRHAAVPTTEAVELSWTTTTTTGRNGSSSGNNNNNAS